MNVVNKIGEKTLVLQLRNNSIGAFDSLYSEYSEKLYAFAFSLLKNREDSKEIVQEVFCRVWNKRHELDPGKSFKSFLFTISYNLIIDRLRLKLKDQEYKNYLLCYFESRTSSNSHKIDYNIIEDRVKSAVEEFPEKRKQVYLLSREEGLSQKEIAVKLGVSVKTVENHINHSLKHIRMRLGKDILMLISLNLILL